MNELHAVFAVPEEADGKRADAVLAGLLDVSRNTAATWCADGYFSSGGRVLSKSDKLHAGQEITADVPEQRDPLAVVVEPVDDLLILADDEHFVVIDKPVGVAAHPSPGWVGPTVVGALAAAGYRISTSGAPERQGIVHRLDVGTSGVMVVAKTEHAYTLLKQAFKERTVDKMYHAVVQGLPDPLKGTIDAPIGRHPGYDWRFAVVEGGRPSVTHYEVLEAFGKASLVEVHLETGRTHQIRVHFSALRHPCAGDLTYGADAKLAAELGLTRQWLHARKLGFTHPATGEYVEFVSEYPQDLQYAVDALRSGEV
ncbi:MULTISPECIES: RluA family pseudouridine synthase [unclassified Arthrobacter]|uniref:RluA family pseudouridine synthase n=1 Tax=unclassified Arthrobacter TaxID=235627 RepID=UPI001E4F717F|nr:MULTISPECIES: RluA family pseudouridine synthase [unclassified Arthrobacter]MCC9145047.1 RluA family pseudouridine synthase [Arthrobacter sp. zg-Y919]MDK1276275.1 RluA family pseudouridine synthase [Arthrobacter sp. zg.Y919]MDM7988914.1 RluA family pseudouridine synthase [Arthrobacter sp. zg-Y877]WIB02119.1 RluA family pseudouridine synthase [Arthrobacter sp. zg-Y919]